MSSRSDHNLRKRKRRSKLWEESESDCSSDISEKNEVVPVSLQNQNDKIDRWVNLLNRSENINVAFLKILGEMEYNILQNLEEFQRKINDRIENIKSIKSEKIYTSSYVKQLKDKINMNLPIQDLKIFEKFNADLEEDIERQNALREYFDHLIEGSSSLANDVYIIMTHTITKSVQIHYSGIGKTHCAKTKKNFSITNVFLCMQDVLIDKYKTSIKELRLVSKVSRWLSQHGDRVDRPVFKNKRTKCPENSDIEQDTE